MPSVQVPQKLQRLADLLKNVICKQGFSALEEVI